nr:hypothetical protein [Tanacetum cinerariifolium]
MADRRTMAELLRAPTEGYAEAIVVPPILAEQFELKHNLINMMTSDKFFGLEKDNPHDHIRWGSPPVARKRTPAFYSHLVTIWRRTQDVLTIIENKSKVHNSQNKAVVSQVKSCDAKSDSSSEIAKLTHAVNQQMSAMTTAMTTILKQFQATPPPAFVKAVKEIYVTFGGAHPYYQCLATGGNTLPELRDNIQGYVSAAAVNYNQGSGSLPSNTVANPKGKLKAITTQSGIVLDGPTIPTPPTFINPKEDEHVEDTLTYPDLSKYTIKVPPPPVQKYKPPSQRDYVLHINITLADALILIPKYQKMFKALLSNKDKLQELANTLLNENYSAVILKKLPKELGDLEKFLILCGFSELKCKALADLEVESDTKNVYDNPFDSKGEKIKESKLLIDELDLPCDFLLPSEYDSILSEDFSKVDALPLTNNEAKVFNPGILIQANLFEVITHIAPEMKDKKLAISHASLMIKDFDPLLYELPFFKEVP